LAILNVSGLKKSYGDFHAVKGVDFNVQPGEIYGLLGPNGAGKTTTISMLCGLLKPDEGSIKILGEDFWSNPRKAQKNLGVVPQELALYEDLSAEENLIFWGKIAGLSGKAAKVRSDELLEKLTLFDRRKEKVRNYSGGMKRRVNIGSALMHGPKLIMMDEPTVGIDPQARNNILDFIKTLASDGSGVLYTTHYLEEAEFLCDRLGIVDKGLILAEGTLSELQGRLSGRHIFLLEGNFEGFDTSTIKEFEILNQDDKQLMVSSDTSREPSDCLQDLLALPLKIENVTFKRPTLNDVFIQLTGHELRE
jgi:ABC-2 type transport system ATP-binding protein